MNTERLFGLPAHTSEADMISLMNAFTSFMRNTVTVAFIEIHDAKFKTELADKKEFQMCVETKRKLKEDVVSMLRFITLGFVGAWFQLKENQ